VQPVFDIVEQQKICCRDYVFDFYWPIYCCH